jgi:hypothetical protein
MTNGDGAVKTATKAPRRKTLQRPVLQFRVHPEVYEQLKSSAKQRKLTISAEAARCIGVAQSLDKQDLTLEELKRRDASDYFEDLGYRMVRDVDGGELWVKGAAALERWAALNPEIETIIDRAVERALQKAKERNQS